jgi:hypothetical protein
MNLLQFLKMKAETIVTKNKQWSFEPDISYWWSWKVVVLRTGYKFSTPYWLLPIRQYYYICHHSALLPQILPRDVSNIFNFNTRTTPSCPGYTDTTRPICQSPSRTISSQCSWFVVHFRLTFSVGKYSRSHLLQNSVQYCTTRPCFRKYSSSARNLLGVATVWVR